LTPTPIVALNRAVALAEVAGSEAALQALDSLALESYHLFHAIRADLLRRVGRTMEAAHAYAAALQRADNARERDFLQRRIDALRGSA
jgi:RNA polymerase sigma-70 factor (ECF subfamily)